MLLLLLAEDQGF